MLSWKTARGVAILSTFLAVTILLGACCGQAPQKKMATATPIWSVEISPVEDTNPTKTQHTFIVTVYDRDGNPVPNVQVHWILARTGDAVGDIVAYDDQDLGDGTAKALTRKTDNQYSVSYTNDRPQILHRGNWWTPNEADWTDFEVGVGQTWCTITSPVEGDSHMIAYVPAIEDATRHKVFAIKHWQRVPHLEIVKECDPEALVGTEFGYRITVSNTGEGATPGSVMLSEMLPEGLTVVDGTTFPMDLGRMEPGATKTVSFRVRADTPGLKVNQAEARAGEFVAMADCSTNVYGYGIDLVKDCSGRYTVGEMVTFNLRVSNTDQATLTNVTVTDPLPAGVEYVSADATAGSASIGADGRTVTWSGFDLPGGGYADLTITARTTQLGMVTNRADVNASVQGTSATVTDSDDCALEVIGLPKLNIDKECLDPNVGIGDVTRFRITVWNSGGADATNVTVTDMLPSGFEPVGETSWYLDVLSPSGRDGGRTFTLEARATAAGTFTNVATASGAGTEEVRDSCDVTVVPPMLTIRKECRAVNPLLGDDLTVLNRLDEATHTITVQNGNTKADDVVVVDTLPVDSNGRERIRYVSSNPAGTYDAATHSITWSLGTMQANETATIDVTFTGIAVGPAINQASVTARGFGGAQDECRLYVIGTPAFQESVVDALGGDVDADNFLVDQPFDYIAMVQNEGDADLKIDITFQLTGGVVLESTPAGFVASASSTSVTQALSISQSGSGYTMESFNLSPRTTKWIKIPVRGTQVTATNAAEIQMKINWQLWYNGQLFPRKGTVQEGETSVIDPR